MILGRAAKGSQPAWAAGSRIEGDLSFGPGWMMADCFSEAPVSLKEFRALEGATTWPTAED